MNLPALRYVTTACRSINIVNKRFGGLKISDTDCSYLYMVYKLNSRGDELTFKNIAYLMRKSGRSFTPQYMHLMFCRFVDQGLLSVEKVPKMTKTGRDCSYNLYSVTPLLVQYLGALEKQIKRTRWDW